MNVYLWVLVGRHCSEGCFWEGEGLKRAPADRVRTVSLDDVEPGVVPMHGVQDDLGREERRVESGKGSIKLTKL